MKIIFLDIDGVLVNRNSLLKQSGLESEPDPPCVEALNRITTETQAVIVVSSTWRLIGETAVRRKLRDWGIQGRVLGITPINRDDRTTTRGREIQLWINVYSRSINLGNYVILDDDADVEMDLTKLIRTQFETGLTMSDADNAIAILNDERR